jgi:hypothetical protein
MALISILRRTQPEPVGVEIMRPSIFRGVWWSSLSLVAAAFGYSILTSDGFDEDAFLLLLLAPFFFIWCAHCSWRAWRLGQTGLGSWAVSDSDLCWVHRNGTVATVALEDIVALRDRALPEIDVVGPRGLYPTRVDLFSHAMVTPGSPGRFFDELAARLRMPTIQPPITFAERLETSTIEPSGALGSCGSRVSAGRSDLTVSPRRSKSPPSGTTRPRLRGHRAALRAEIR